jgi:hypothetical protein
VSDKHSALDAIVRAAQTRVVNMGPTLLQYQSGIDRYLIRLAVEKSGVLFDKLDGGPRKALF